MTMKTRLPSLSLTLLQRKKLVSLLKSAEVCFPPFYKTSGLPFADFVILQRVSFGNTTQFAFLQTPEGVTHRDGVLGHHVSSEFLIHVVDPVKIKLRLDENVWFQVYLHPHRAVQLKMIGTREEGTLVIADRGGGAGLLVEI